MTISFKCVAVIVRRAGLGERFQIDFEEEDRQQRGSRQEQSSTCKIDFYTVHVKGAQIKAINI
jgi:hypothetical protein